MHNYGNFEITEIFNIELLLIDIIHFCILFLPFNERIAPFCDVCNFLIRVK